MRASHDDDDANALSLSLFLFSLSLSLSQRPKWGGGKWQEREGETACNLKKERGVPMDL